MSIISIVGLGDPVTIQLIDNPFTKMFVEHFTEVAATHSGKLMRRMVGAQIPTDANFATKHQQLIDVVSELNDIAGNFPYTLDHSIILERNQNTQNLLNQLHRCFTTAYRCASRRQPLVWSDKFASSFTVAEDKFTRLLELLILLNDHIHDLELYVDTDNKKFCRGFSITQAEIHIDGAYDKCENIRSIYLDIPEEHYQYFSDSEECDVWVGIDILGKSYLNAFWDNDDPSEWDVTHQLGITGKIYIETSINKKLDILKTERFNNWLAAKNLTYKPYMCGMPIGTVISNRDLLTKGSGIKPNLQLSVDL